MCSVLPPTVTMSRQLCSVMGRLFMFGKAASWRTARHERVVEGMFARADMYTELCCSCLYARNPHTLHPRPNHPTAFNSYLFNDSCSINSLAALGTETRRRGFETRLVKFNAACEEWGAGLETGSVVSETCFLMCHHIATSAVELYCVFVKRRAQESPHTKSRSLSFLFCKIASKGETFLQKYS